ncbi:hypothetical protein [Paenibacillus sp. DYY-L-2]|uniref:hypothetical protein n=1 Tax=Paenibacillus sp. DYY-L-2 TaxID=3447013 RepID=UPI003F4F6302
MSKRWAPLLVVSVLVMVAGCMGQPNTPEPSRQETIIEENVAHKGENAPLPVEEVSEAEEKPTLKPDPPESESESESAKLAITTGDDVKLETSLEHETAIFDGREYTIEPYGVTFALRTSMGDPAVEDEKIVFSSDLSGEASFMYEVRENTTLDEAVGKELQEHGDAFYGEFVETTSKGGLKGKHNQYYDDSVFAGVFFYEFDRHVLRIEYRSPIAAVDAMVRMVNETVDSVKMED